MHLFLGWRGDVNDGTKRLLHNFKNEETLCPFLYLVFGRFHGSLNEACVFRPGTSPISLPRLLTCAALFLNSHLTQAHYQASGEGQLNPGPALKGFTV